jgi:hypothetical protein
MKAKYSAFALALFVLLGSLSCGKLGKSTDNNADDGTNPSSIGDLRVTAFTATTARLIWTATGDDSTAGTAVRYDLRRYPIRINYANWDSAIQVTGLPAPSPAGQLDSILVTGLIEDSTYYFAIMAYDEANNSSGISNNTFVTCFNDYIVTFPDSNLELAVREQIFKPTGDIHRSDVINMTSLAGNDKNITLLDGLAQCEHLVNASFVGDHISDLTPIASMHGFNFLGLTFNNVTDISPLAGLTNLTTLQLRSNHVVDISALANMNKLHLLDCVQNQITDISPLVADTGFATGDTVWITENPLSQQSLTVDIPQIEARGATVIH